MGIHLRGVSALKAIILAGGLGTRMREETEFRPKPMVEVGGKPIIWHIMKHLEVHGIREFIIAAGYKADVIKQYFLDYDARNNDFTIELGKKGAIHFHNNHKESDWVVTVADTGPNTHTGGRIARAARYLDDSPFMVAYGDGVANVDVSALLDFHQQQQTLATATVVRPPSRYGVLDVHSNGRVGLFQEKPQLEGWINIGFFILQPEVLSYLTGDFPFETGPLTQLASEGQLSAFKHDGFWRPMDTYRESQDLNNLWDLGKAPWKTW